MAVALATIAIASCSLAKPEPPEGYHFPTRSVGDSGPAALLTGELQSEHGCLYVQPSDGERFLVIWPDTLRLELIDGAPTVLDGNIVVARLGDVVRVTGGESGDPSSTEGAPCTGLEWRASQVER